MRCFCIYFLLFIFVIPIAKAGEKNKGLELKFSLIHPSLRKTDYRYSTDPSLEAFYYSFLTNNTSFSVGIAAKTGIHKWQILTGHTFFRGDGIPYRLRTNYNRRYKYFCAGVPVKIEKEFGSSGLYSGYIKILGGIYFFNELIDYYESEYVAELDADFEQLFWDVQLGFNRTVYQSGTSKLALSPLAGIHYRSSHHHYPGNYFYYGLGLSLKLK